MGRFQIIAATLALLFIGEMPAVASSSPEFCIVRPGENGSLNILPVTVVVQDFAELTINGEEEVCLRPFISEASTLQVRLRFRHPYWDWRKPEYWTTPAVLVRIKPGVKTVVILCPRLQSGDDRNWDKWGWHNTWVLSPPEHIRACGPLYENWKE